MNIRRLGNSDMNITRIGLGTWAIGGPWKYGWGKQDEKTSVRTIHAALDAGINWIDTAPAYGLGNAESVVGKAVAASGYKPYIFTKCSLVWNKNGDIIHSLKAESIRKEAENSLRRLSTDAIDLYQLHWPYPKADIEEGWKVLSRLKEEGKVRYIGLSNFTVKQMERLSIIAPITSLQPPCSLINRSIEDLQLPYCRKNGIGVIAYSPMGSGLLSGAMTRERISTMEDGDWRKTHPDFCDPQLSKNLAIANRLEKFASRRGVTAGAAAVAWVLSRPGITGAIAGLRTPEQLQDILCADETDLGGEDFA